MHNLQLPSKESLTSRSRSKLLKDYLNEGIHGVPLPSMLNYKLSNAMKAKISKSFRKEANSHSVLEA